MDRFARLIDECDDYFGLLVTTVTAREAVAASVVAVLVVAGALAGGLAGALGAAAIASLASAAAGLAAQRRAVTIDAMARGSEHGTGDERRV